MGGPQAPGTVCWEGRTPETAFGPSQSLTLLGLRGSFLCHLPWGLHRSLDVIGTSSFQECEPISLCSLYTTWAQVFCYKLKMD